MKTLTIECPKCGKQGKKKTQSRIKLSKNPKAREQILDGSLFKWECPECKESFFMQAPFLYNDDENRFMVYFIPGFKERSYKIPTVIKTLNDYDTDSSVLRIAPSFVELVEKIRILEAGLDDRVVESVKLLYSNMHAQDKGEKVFSMVFESCEENGDMHFGVYLEDKDFEAVLPQSVYDLAIIDISPMFGGDPEDEFIVVDQTWLSAKLADKK